MTTEACLRGAGEPALRTSQTVIVLRRPNGHPIVVNADLIETVEVSEDGATVVTLTTGNALLVTQTPEEVREAAVEFRRQIAFPPS